jgi:putative ABC transport system permease protein
VFELLEIGPWRVAASYLFLILLLIMSLILKLGRGREFITASVRMTIQLVLAGYLLELVFTQRHVLVSLGILLVMQAFALVTVFGRIKGKINPTLKRVAAAALFAGTSLPLFFFLLVVVGVSPWYGPRYFIPIAGMTIGNSMTGISLGMERLLHGFRSSRPRVEEALMLGATPQLAVRDVVNEAFVAAIIPTINSMLGMGIVFLPGMMTGQILAGASPLTAIEYQLAIMMSILGSVSMTVFLLVRQGYRTFFNERAQLKEDF